MNHPDNTTSHRAADYDRNVRLTIPYYDAIQDEILNFIQASCNRPRSWLDTGCGTGSLVKKAAAIFPETEFVVADPSQAMLDRACGRLAGCRYTFAGAFGTADLPSRTSRSFDIITAIQCHHYLDAEGRRSAIRACHALLAEDGTFITSENIRPSSDEGIERSLAYWGDYQRRAGRSIPEIRAHRDRFDREYFPITLAEHLRNFHEAGFHTAEVLWLSYLQAVFWCRK